MAFLSTKFLRLTFFIPASLPFFYKIFNRVHNFTSIFLFLISVRRKNIPAKKLQPSRILHLFSLLKFAKFTYQFHDVKLTSKRATPVFLLLPLKKFFVELPLAFFIGVKKFVSKNISDFSFSMSFKNLLNSASVKVATSRKYIFLNRESLNLTFFSPANFPISSAKFLNDFECDGFFSEL